MEEIEDEKECRRVVNLQPAYTQEPRNFMREENRSCINSGELRII
jgi:hypothetical protein